MSFRNCVLVALAAAFAVSCGSSSTTTEKQKLYLTLATSGSNKVVVIDPVTDTKTTEITVGGEPHDAICAPNGKKVYVSNPATNNVSVIDTATDKVTATIDMGNNSTPWHVEVSPDGKWVFVALQGSKEIAIIDTATDTVKTKISTADANNNIRSPWALSAPANNKVYATLNGIIAGQTANQGSELASFDPTATNPTLTFIKVGDGPHGLFASTDKSTLFVAAQKGHEVWKVNVADNAASKYATIDVANPPALSPGFPTDVATTSSGMILVGNHDVDSVSFIKSDGTVTTVSTGAGTQPWGGSFSPDGKKAYISTNGVSTISVFDVATMKETGKITTGAGPDGMTWCKI